MRKSRSSCYPRHFHDDGTVITLDLHGCAVDDALDVLGRTVREAHRRGRKQVVAIHGTSSSERAEPVRTIKTELARRLDDGTFAQWVADTYWSDGGGRCTLWLRIGPKENAARIRLLDVV